MSFLEQFTGSVVSKLFKLVNLARVWHLQPRIGQKTYIKSILTHFILTSCGWKPPPFSSVVQKYKIHHLEDHVQLELLCVYYNLSLQIHLLSCLSFAFSSFSLLPLFSYSLCIPLNGKVKHHKSSLSGIFFMLGNYRQSAVDLFGPVPWDCWRLPRPKLPLSCTWSANKSKVAAKLISFIR